MPWTRSMSLPAVVLCTVVALALTPSAGATPGPRAGATVARAKAPTAPPARPTAAQRRAALHTARFILALQTPGGAIRDVRGVDRANEDSNMQYALLGLAAAYVATRHKKYLRGFEAGIGWLADREEMTDPAWRGSWFYVYSTRPPYRHLPTSPGLGVTDVRGVDTTSAYFTYLLWIDSQLPGNHHLAQRYAENGRAALDFVIRRNWASNGATYSSWQRVQGRWRLWRYQYTADQADVYLGMRAGAALYDSAEYARRATALRRSLKESFFDPRAGRYAEGRDGGSRDWDDEFDAVFPQGYVPWALGRPTRQTRAAHHWLATRQRRDGRIVAYPGDPGFALSTSILALAATTTGAAWPAKSVSWLLSGPYDRSSGGVRDTAARRSPQYSNVAGFTVLALLRQRPRSWSVPTVP